jgi:uncharacterized protein YndB with AHSA1/START domain
MVRVDVTRVLPVPRREGFDYITDVRNWPDYWPSAVELPDPDHTSWSQPGDRATVVVESRGRPVAMSMHLEEFSPPERVSYGSTQDGLVDFHHERIFDEKDGKLEYTLAIEFEPRRGPPGLIDRLFLRPAARRALVETMDNLERIFTERNPSKAGQEPEPGATS